MNSKFSISLPVLGCLALASCYPIPDGRRNPQGAGLQEEAEERKTVASQDQQKIQAQRDRLKQREQKKETTTSSTTPRERTRESTASNSSTTTKPVEPKRTDYSFANPVPGKEGFVFSPYNNKLVDVRDIPSGTLVQDPTYPAAEKKYFRVP